VITPGDYFITDALELIEEELKTMPWTTQSWCKTMPFRTSYSDEEAERLKKRMIDWN